MTAPALAPAQVERFSRKSIRGKCSIPFAEPPIDDDDGTGDSLGFETIAVIVLGALGALACLIALIVMVSMRKLEGSVNVQFL